MNSTQIISILEKIFSKYDILVGVLFGSYAKGTQKATSDIDIAFYPSSKFKVNDEIKLREEIEKKFSKYSIDIVNLKTSNNLELIFTIFKTGICIYERKESIFKTMKYNAWMDFTDFNSQYKELKERVREKQLNELLTV